MHVYHVSHFTTFHWRYLYLNLYVLRRYQVFTDNVPHTANVHDMYKCTNQHVMYLFTYLYLYLSNLYTYIVHTYIHVSVSRFFLYFKKSRSVQVTFALDSLVLVAWQRGQIGHAGKGKQLGRGQMFHEWTAATRNGRWIVIRMVDT